MTRSMWFTLLCIIADTACGYAIIWQIPHWRWCALVLVLSVSTNLNLIYRRGKP